MGDWDILREEMLSVSIALYETVLVMRSSRLPIKLRIGTLAAANLRSDFGRAGIIKLLAVIGCLTIIILRTGICATTAIDNQGCLGLLPRLNITILQEYLVQLPKA
jgi:hypothetical protein